jgi:hypothetical protein
VTIFARFEKPPSQVIAIVVVIVAVVAVVGLSPVLERSQVFGRLRIRK